MPVPVKKIGISLVSSTIALAAAWVYLESRRPTGTVVMVDDRKEVHALLDRRSHEEESPAITPEEGVALTLVREPLPEEVARMMYAALRREDTVHEPRMILRRRGHLDRWQKFREHPEGGWRERTNALGMREDAEVRVERPDLRILVTGDSHTYGLCANDESFTNLLEAMLAGEREGEVVEALNAGQGAYDPYNYLGVLERYRGLDPDVFIAVVFGGNDFSGPQHLYRYFNRLPPGAGGPHDPMKIVPYLWKWGGIEAQEIHQAIYFRNNPSDEETAARIVACMAAEMQRICREDGIQLLCVYLPPPFRGQPEQLADEIEPALSAIGWEYEELACSDRIADRWLAFLKRRGIAHLDLRPEFRAAERCYFWRADHHLNLDGHRAVAESLARAVRELLK